MPFAHFFTGIASNIQSIVLHGGYFILIAITLLEGLPLIGMVIPGHTAIIMAGFFARLGVFNLGYVMLIAAFGAVIGDFIGFYIGRRYGMSFIDKVRPYFFIRDSHIQKARDLLSRHTGKAIILGRFSPLTRSLMPFLVGTSHTSSARFWTFNIIGGVSWAVSSVLLGYLFGTGYHLASSYLGKVVLIGILLAILIIWAYRFVNMRFHIFRKYELFTLILNLLSLWGLSEMIEDAWTSPSFVANFDVWVNIIMDKLNHASSLVASLAHYVSLIGGTYTMMGLALLFGIYFIWRGHWRSAAVMLFSMFATVMGTGILKELFLRARPLNALELIINDPSFPSGHAAFAASFFFCLAYLMAPRIHSWAKREIMIVLCILAIILIGLSRLVLNVHWASDVIGGWSLGIFAATGSILLVRYVGALFVKKPFA